jgi:hypothetical protein
MSAAFRYKPKFVDIRVRPPKPEEEEAAADVHTLKPGERRCDYPGCLSAATAKAPKSREMLNEHYWFCQPHASEYNKNWNFFAGMSEAEVAEAQAARATGERPTWAFRASRLSREAAAFAAKMGAGKASDPFGLFGEKAKQAKARAEERRLGRLEKRALDELDLDADADPPTVRARYAELVKRFHPDSNGGDRSAEARLQRVLRAYRTLKAAKLA